jgi:hypothetical protein
MPTYKNNAAIKVRRGGGCVWQPGEEIPLGYYVPPGAELAVTSDAPPVKSGLFVATVTDGELALPACGRGELSLLAMGGEAKAWIADDGDPIVLPEGVGFEDAREWNRTGKIRVEGTAQVVWKEALYG